jgi:hypothetical protein
MKSGNDAVDAAASFATGMGVGMLATCFNAPFDVVKSRVQVRLIYCLKNILICDVKMPVLNIQNFGSSTSLHQAIDMSLYICVMKAAESNTIFIHQS